MLTKPWRAFCRFLATDRGLSSFFIMIVVVAFVVPPLGSPSLARRLVLDIFFSLLLIAGIVSMSRRRRIVVPAAVVAVIAIIFRWAALLGSSPLLEIPGYLSAITIHLLFCIVVLTEVLRKGLVTGHRILGAIGAYLLLGIAWSHAYDLIEYLSPGSFAGSITHLGRFTSWTYFSFVTLASIGYGDIAPLHPVARSLATAEGITGQFYMAVLIARLVSDLRTQN